ncbi:hypothetical protein [Kribbella monticola]|uniref:hypothetical protein n=1 Tax=Kribbella monticola TaxID=2185285 RepID=UPI000DD4A01E|nr:hypothetical protein [Kribbella monticola]
MSLLSAIQQHSSSAKVTLGTGAVVLAAVLSTLSASAAPAASGTYSPTETCTVAYNHSRFWSEDHLVIHFVDAGQKFNVIRRQGDEYLGILWGRTDRSWMKASDVWCSV